MSEIIYAINLIKNLSNTLIDYDKQIIARMQAGFDAMYSTLNFTVAYLYNLMKTSRDDQINYLKQIISMLAQVNTGNNTELLNKLDQALANINYNIYAAQNNVINEVNKSTYILSSKIDDSVAKIGNALAAQFSVINAKLDNVYTAQKMDITALQNYIAGQNQITQAKITQETNAAKDKLYSLIEISQSKAKADVINATNAAKDKLTGDIKGLTNTVASLSEKLSTEIKGIEKDGTLPKGLEDIPTILDFLQVFITSMSGLGDEIGNSYARLSKVVYDLTHGKFTSYTQFIAALDSLGGAGQLANTLFNLVKFVWISTYGIISSTEPFINNMQWLARGEARDQRLSAEQMAAYYMKTGQQRPFVQAYFESIGYSNDDINRLLIAATSMLSPDIIRFLYLNGNIDENLHDRFLTLIGFQPTNIFWIKQTYWQIPPVQDLIVMAVREAFSPEIANLFGQYEGYPQILTDYMKRQGIKEEWAQRYWASHWKLPSPDQGFEMFHRGIINEDTLRLLLRALDIMPFWRDKLINLNYAVLRLVDIRRFYELGVINEEQMYKEYLARGYNPERANWAVTWTKEFTSKGNEQEQAERRMLNQTVIVKSLNSGRISEAQAITMLEELRYSRADAELIIAVYQTDKEIEREDIVIDDNKKRLIKLATDGYSQRLINHQEAIEMLVSSGYSLAQARLELEWHDYEVENQIKAHVVAWFKELYTTWKIDQQQFITSLGEYGFDANEINRLLAEFDILRETRTRAPTFEMIRRWFRNGIISQEQYTNELRGQGYDEKYIAYFMTEELQQ